MPLSLAGVRRILDEFMDWTWREGGDEEPGGNIRIGAVSAEDVYPDDDVLIIIAPQNIVGYPLLPRLQAMCDAAGDRPVILISPRMVDIPSSGGVMSYVGREQRLAWCVCSDALRSVG